MIGDVQLEIPYDGMTLKWLYHSEIVQNETRTVQDETWLFTYTKLNESRFEMKDLVVNWTYVVDVTTRKILSGPTKTYIGTSTSHWIFSNFSFTDFSIGDSVEILGDDFKVVSTNEDVWVPSINSGVEVKCFEFERTTQRDTLVYTESYYYDVNTGIKVMWADYGESVGGDFFFDSQVILIETGIDMDKDGLTDYKELFVTFTNPRKSDTDGDLWNDSLDIVPRDAILPNGIIALIIAGMGGFLTYRFLKRRKAAFSSSPSTQ